eukprot:11547102-Ditylum_brightwellii.AAC.1
MPLPKLIASPSSSSLLFSLSRPYAAVCQHFSQNTKALIAMERNNTVIVVLLAVVVALLLLVFAVFDVAHRFAILLLLALGDDVVKL